MGQGEKGERARRGQQIETSLQIRREIGVKKKSKNDSRVEWSSGERNGVFKGVRTAILMDHVVVFQSSADQRLSKCAKGQNLHGID